MNFKEYFTKLQNLPDNKKKVILWTIVGVLAVIMGSFWINWTVRDFKKLGETMGQINFPEIKTPDVGIINEQIEEVVNSTSQGQQETENWKVYSNNQYKYEIKYPENWNFREYISGVAFSPIDDNFIQGAVAVGFYARGTDYCKIAFEDYVKIAGPSEIQNFESLNAGEEGLSEQGVPMFRATWNYIDMQGNKKVSLPITYYKPNNEDCGSIDASLNEEKYADTYNKMILTFKFTN